MLTGCLPNYDLLGDLTIKQDKAPYCNLYGYTLKLCREVSPPYQNPRSHAQGYSWSRLAVMLQLVESGDFDWVYCVGCDTVITNHLIGLEDLIATAGRPGKRLPAVVMRLPPGVPAAIQLAHNGSEYKPDGEAHVIFAADRASVVQADSFFIRGSRQGAAYLRDVLSRYPVYQTEPWVEQQAMADLRHRHAAITCIVPQCVMNSYDYALYDHFGPYYRAGLDCYGKRGQWQPGDFLIHWPSTPLDKRLELARHYMKESIR